MALNYDEFGNVIGEYESEEERRKRLEAAAKAADNTVATEQKVVTYQNGSQTVETKKEIPARAPVIDPNVVANARAMAPPPDAVFQRQLQAESGNRQIDPRTGQIMTSPAGALGIAQIMPATAMQPGYGVPSIFDLAQQQGIQFQNRDEATAKQLLGNQALNQQFGQNYKNAMLQRFGGDQAAATASYNAGPGRVGQNMANNQGNLNVAQLPQETQGYLQKVLGNVGNVVNRMIPSAQAGTLPQAQPMAQAQPQPMAPTQLPPQPQAQPQAAEPISPYSLATNNTGMGIRAPGIAAGQPMPQPMAQPTINFQNLFQQSQDNINGLTQIIDNPDAPEYLKKRSADRRYELVNNTYMEEKAKAKIPNLTSNEVAKALSTTPRDAEGSWLKFLLMGFISPQLAGAEAIKLGLGPTKWTSTTITDDDGNQTNVEIQSRVDGKILAGNIAGTGQALTPEQLQQAAGVVSLGTSTKPDVGAVYEQKDANGKVTAKGRLVTEFRNNRPQTYIDLGNGKRAKFDSSWVTERISTAAATADIGLITDLKKKHGNNVLDAEKDYVALNGPFKSNEDRQQFRQAYGFGMAQPGMAGGQPGMATGQPAQGQTQAGMAGGQPAQGQTQASKINVPLEQQKQDRASAGIATKEIITEAAKEVAKSADTQNLLNSINKVTGLIDSGNHNIGSVLSGAVGRGPIAQAIGSQFETTDAKNTKIIMDTVNKLAADGLKTLGSNPSTADLEFWTRFKPDASSDPAFVREWIDSRSADLKRRIGYAEKQVGAGGAAGVAPAVGTSGQSSVRQRADSIIGR
jgi:hypothetical protein